MDMSKHMLGIAGEFRVCAELLKKGFQASVTFGNNKATDIIVAGENHKFVRVEVKTSKNQKNFVTGYYPKYTDLEKIHPDIWVFYSPDKELSTTGDRFFIATHDEIGKLQLVVNNGNKTEKGGGVDNIPLSKIPPEFENRWHLLEELLK